MLEMLVKFFALWGLWVCPAILLLCLWGIARLGRGRRFLIPATWKARAATAVLVVVLAVNALLAWAVVGPLEPLADGLRRFHRLKGHETADVAFRTVAEDAERSLHEFRGQVTVVNLWATWCGPCVHEMPELDRLQKSYRDRGLSVVTLSQEERQKLLFFAQQHAYDMTSVYAEDVGWLDVADSRPVSVVIDRQGVLREFVLGARDYEGFEKLIKPYLGS